jgi:hypothetical protein
VADKWITPRGQPCSVPQFQSRVGITDVSSLERTEASCVGPIRPVLEGGQADNARKRGGEEQNAQIRAQWEILATTYVQLADQSKKIDDTGTHYDPLDRS